MSNAVLMFSEPDLEFRYGQRAKDPHDGLALFGPYDSDLPTRPGSLSYIVLGCETGLDRFHAWSSAMSRPATEAPRGNHRLWPPYPGFEAAFSVEWRSRPTWSYQVACDDLLRASRHRDPHERAYNVVEYYLEGLRRASKLDERFGVAVCVVPDEVWVNCRPKSYVADPIDPPRSGKIARARKAGQLDFFEEYEPEQYWLSPDFRRQLKARAMELEIPLQIIRESTLKPNDIKVFGERNLTPLADRMWNLGTALYYKCGGKPWRLVSARDGVCYIGIAFRRAGEGNTACCAAQMFLNSGDGVVFLGQFGPWYSPSTKQFHLSKEAARLLLEGTLQTYAELGGKTLTEVFLHARSEIDDDEFAGYQEACPAGVKLVGVRVRASNYGPRMYRAHGQMPIVRGTFWRLNERTAFLWASGFKPRLATYDGWETPVPLRIDIQHGDAPIERVGQDIFGLTKLNYNACRLGEAQPVTVGFSDAVGEILVTNPHVTHRKPQFKYYI